MRRHEMTVAERRPPPGPFRRLRWLVPVLLLLASCGRIGIDRRDEHGMTALMHAARQGDRTEVERLMGEGANVNAAVPRRDFRELVAFLSFMQQLPASDIGYTPLLYAVEGGSSEVVRLLIDRGADVHHVASGGQTALSMALAQSNLELARLLIAAGAAIDPSHLAQAVARSSPEAVRFLLAAGADPNALPAPDSKRPGPPTEPLVVVAAVRGDITVLGMLIQAGVDVNARDRNGWSALRWVRHLGERSRGFEPAPMLALLEGAGARDEAGERADALLDAVHGRDTARVREALDTGADPNSRDERGVPPLIYAGNRGESEIVRALVDAGADVNADPEHDTTPLIAAIEGGSLQAVEILLQAGAKVDQPDRIRRTPLEVASSWKRTEITALLLGAGAAPAPAALASAALNGDLEQVRMLLARGADPNAGEGYVLAEAARGCHRNDNTEVIRALVEAGADPRVRDNLGYTPLHRAAGMCEPEIVELLIRRGADPDARDANGFTPLIGAAGSGRIENVRLLVAAGADVNGVDIDGKSVLEYARDHPEVQQELRRAGAR